MTSHLREHTPLFPLFSPKVQEILRLLFSQGFYVTLVGGAVRDFLLSGQIPSDLDFELRVMPGEKEGQVNLTGDKGDNRDAAADWEETMASLKKRLLEEGIEVTSLPFGILRLNLANEQVELISPRREIFIEGDVSHKNFIAQLSPHLSYAESFLRRDFTLNAIGVEFMGPGKETWVDPFAGEKDFRRGVLRPCHKNFIKDPVRFLRLIRFSLQFQWTWEAEVELLLPQFDLSQLGSHFFFYEGIRSGDFLAFVRRFFQLVEFHRLPISAQLERWRFLQKVHFPRPVTQSRDFYLLAIRELPESAPQGQENLQILMTALGQSYSQLKQYRRYYQFLRDWHRRDWEELRHFIRESRGERDLEKLLRREDFQLLLKGLALRKRLLTDPWKVLPELEMGEWAKFMGQLLEAGGLHAPFPEIVPQHRSAWELYQQLRSLWGPR